MMSVTAAGGVIALNSKSVEAHEFLLRYNLPVPFELYLYACAATLVITFVLFGWFMSMPASRPVSSKVTVAAAEPIGRLSGWVVGLLRAAALGCLGLTVAAGLIGTRDPDANINLTLFWQVFLLGLTYATALIGNVYEFLNPWKSIVEWVQRGTPDSFTPRLAYPRSFGYWPAVIFYIALIWIELFTHPGPRALSVILIVYSLINFAGVWLFKGGRGLQFDCKTLGATRLVCLGDIL